MPDTVAFSRALAEVQAARLVAEKLVALREAKDWNSYGFQCANTTTTLESLIRNHWIGWTV